MKTFIVLIAAFHAVMITGCTTKPKEAGAATKKVADQTLATYNSMRRLTYKDACGSDGPITICVYRITTSETTTLVDVKINNSSPYVYLLGNKPTASVLLINDANETLEWADEKSRVYLEHGNMDIQFKMNWHFTGEPVTLIVNNIISPLDQNEKGFSIAVKLDN